MRFAIAVLACALAVANAQIGQFPQSNYGRYQPSRQPYKPYVSYPGVPPAPKVVASAAVKRVPSVVVSPVPVVVPVAKVAADARSAEIIRSAYDLNDDGSYNYYFETNNGIAAQAQGTPRNFGGNPPLIPDVAQGSFSWVSPEGKTIAITYVADENGYQPQGDALPVGPEVPPQIARALAYTAKYHGI